VEKRRVAAFMKRSGFIVAARRGPADVSGDFAEAQLGAIRW
jgi:hypothetical protein